MPAIWRAKKVFPCPWDRTRLLPHGSRLSIIHPRTVVLATIRERIDVLWPQSLRGLDHREWAQRLDLVFAWKKLAVGKRTGRRISGALAVILMPKCSPSLTRISLGARTFHCVLPR